MNNDLSLDLYLWSLKLHRGHLSFLRYFYADTQEFLPSRHKFLTELNNLGLIFKNTITPKGRSLYEEVLAWDGEYTPQIQPKKAERTYSEEFTRWWDSWPKTDAFVYEGVEFQGVRNFKKDKEVVSTKYEQIASIVGHDRLLASLLYEVEYRQNLSLISGKNQLTFMCGPKPYLNQSGFEVHLDKGKFKTAQGDNRVKINTTAY